MNQGQQQIDLNSLLNGIMSQQFKQGNTQQQGQQQENIMEMNFNQVLEKYGNNLDNKENYDAIFKLIGPIKVNEIATAFMTKDKSFLDKHHDKLKLILKDLTEKSGSRQNLIDEWASQISLLFVPDQANQNKVIEGFESQLIAQDILQQRLGGLLETIDQNYEGNNKISYQFFQVLENLLGELVFELSQGLNNQVMDFGIIFQNKLSKLLQEKLGANNNPMLMFIVPTIWMSLQQIHNDYAKKTQQFVQEDDMD